MKKIYSRYARGYWLLQSGDFKRNVEAKKFSSLNSTNNASKQST